jgi:uncharacterized protein
LSAASLTPVQSLQPIGARERVELIDVLRGISLLGILLVNFGFGDGRWMPRADAVTREFLVATIGGSFFPLFAFLFGLGFAVQLERARDRGTGVTLLYLRRMLALFLIGAVHAVLIWRGDVLVAYAMYGLLFIPLHRLRDRWLLPIPLLILGVGLYQSQISAFVTKTVEGPPPPQLAELRYFATGAQLALENGRRERIDAKPGGATRLDHHRAAVIERWNFFAKNTTAVTPINPVFYLQTMLAFSVLGLIAGRRRILHEAAKHRRALLWTAIVSGIVVVVSDVFIYSLAPDARATQARTLLTRIAYIGQNNGSTIFYIAFVATVFQAPRIAAKLRIFAATGKIGLTTYLMQSIVMTLLLEKYGLGLEHPGVAVLVIVHLAFYFGAQVPFSRWWTARFTLGPAEWVWRSLAYGAIQPLRATRDDDAVALPRGEGLPGTSGRSAVSAGTP